MKIYIPQALEELKIGKTKLYKLFTETNVKPKKEGKKSYLTNDQMLEIKAFIGFKDENEQVRTNERTEKNFSEYRIEQLEKELAEERDNNKQLTLQVGQWQGRAKTLEEQNLKFLEIQSTIPERPELPKKSWWQVWKK